MNKKAMGLEDIIMILLVFFISSSAVNNKGNGKKPIGKIELSINKTEAIIKSCKLKNRNCEYSNNILNIKELDSFLNENCSSQVSLFIDFNQDAYYYEARKLISQISNNTCIFYEK